MREQLYSRKGHVRVRDDDAGRGSGMSHLNNNLNSGLEILTEEELNQVVGGAVTQSNFVLPGCEDYIKQLQTTSKEFDF